jgi:uncharacterized phage-like protein YoqJ
MNNKISEQLYKKFANLTQAMILPAANHENYWNHNRSASKKEIWNKPNYIGNLMSFREFKYIEWVI